MKTKGCHLWNVKISYGKFSHEFLSLWITTKINSAVEAAQNTVKYCNRHKSMYPKLSINCMTYSGTIDA
jgi:hypothetical protein